jgi:MFS family permease
VFFGLLSAFEVPTRQSLIAELVDREDLMNAIALNSSAFNLARVVGPAVAGLLISTVGLSACFFTNAVSYLAVIIGLLSMRVRRDALPPAVPAFNALMEGVRYVFGNPWPRALIGIIATFSVFGFSFMTMMPVFARDALGLDAAGYGALVSTVGIGAATGAIGMAGLGGQARRARLVIGSSVLFGVLLASAALAPNFPLALLLFTLTGCTMALNSILANTMLQLQAPDQLRGRVMGFYSFVVLGMAPFGAFQAGWVSEHYGARASFALGGIACLLLAGLVAWAVRAEGRRGAEERRPVAHAETGEVPPPLGSER